MTAECPCERERERATRSAPWGSATTFLVGVAAVFIPKCPLCVAAYLSMLGLSAAASSALAPRLLPLGIGLALLSLASAALVVLRARRMR